MTTALHAVGINAWSLSPANQGNCQKWSETVCKQTDYPGICCSSSRGIGHGPALHKTGSPELGLLHTRVGELDAREQLLHLLDHQRCVPGGVLGIVPLHAFQDSCMLLTGTLLANIWNAR